MQANSFRILTTYILLIIWVAQQRYQPLQVSRKPFSRGLRKVEDLRSGRLKIFSNKICAGMLIRDLKVADIVLLMKSDVGHRQRWFYGGVRGGQGPRNFLAPLMAPTFLERNEILKFLQNPRKERHVSLSLGFLALYVSNNF